MVAVLAVQSSESAVFRETRSRRGKLKGLHFRFFLHCRDTFLRRSIGYSELEVVAASSQRQSEFLCAEACHTPIEDAIFWRASPWKHALGKYGILPPSKYSLDYGNTQLTNQIESLAVTSYLFRDNYS